MTTSMSNVGFVIAAVIAGQAVSEEMYIQIAIPLVAMGLAYLDIKYPRYAEYVDKFFDLMGRVDAERV